MLNTDYYHSRYFNTLSRDGYVIHKSSTNIDKIRSEYDYYYFLPSEAQHYFVQPFDYRVIDGVATYSMEYIEHHNFARSVELYGASKGSFVSMLGRIENFKNFRIAPDYHEVLAESRYLVLDKTRVRLSGLHADIFERLESAYYAHLSKRTTWNKVLSHGDMCFSNIIWIPEVNLIRFIDPRGAKTKEDIYLDEYYDLAKISHSIFGGYESIIYDTDIDYSEIQGIFLKFLDKHDISVELILVYEASLFLSMIPLHKDKPENVKRFLHRCTSILDRLGH